MKVTVIINCCYEGLLLRKSVESALRSIAASGISDECEIIAVADNVDEATSLVIDQQVHNFNRVLHTSFGDLGLARNAGAAAGQGTVVMFLDGDDLWGKSWVGAAWREHLVSPGPTVLHPQYCAFFGASTELLVQPDWRDPQFDPRGLVARNHWTSPCCINRELLTECPFPAAAHSAGFGFEDWSWHAQTIAHGFRHAVVPKTVHLIRKKVIASMQHSMLGHLPIPSRPFAEYLAADDPDRPHDL